MDEDGWAARLLPSSWILICLILGGSSGGGLLANGLLQIAAGILIVWVIHRGALTDTTSAARGLLALTAVAAGYLLITLLPLPPVLWRLLPGRSGVDQGFTLVGMPAQWLSLSLSPDATIAVLLSFLPPVAMFLAVLASSTAGRRLAVSVLAGAALVSVLLGVAQQLAGFRSDLYLYQITSRGGAVGFFANRNHLATLCLMTLPLLAALAAAGRRSRSDKSKLGSWTLAATGFLLLVVGTIIVQSRAGWLLLAPTLLGCWLLFSERGRPSPRQAYIVGGMLVVALLLALFAPIAPVDLNLAIGELGPSERRGIMRVTLDAALNFLPFGAGLGVFDQIYPTYENAAGVTGAFINHAHNDHLELLLEGGLPGVALLVTFGVWWIARIREAWRPEGGALMKAACVSIGALVAHSFVDYPFRTAAIAAVAAFACGLAATREIAASRSSRRSPERVGTTRTIMLGRGARASSGVSRSAVAS